MALRRSEPAAAVRPRVLLTTEGTYPYVLGGVSAWCDLLVRRLTEVDWRVLPIVGPDAGRRRYEFPAHAREVGCIRVWGDTSVPRAHGMSWLERGADRELPAILVRHLIGWGGNPDAVIAAWVHARRRPASILPAFRSRHGWAGFLAALCDVLSERVPEAGTPPALDLVEAAALYQTLYWVAVAAAMPTPVADVLHVTAAGWAAIPAVVHRAIYGTPMVLTEHGVYVREAYLAGAREGGPPGTRFAVTRLARGLARVAYAAADVVSPVTDANAYWELGLGVDDDRLHPVYNGVHPTGPPTLPPRTTTVVSVGRIDALKDFHTMLRVATEVLRHLPGAQFLHYGPVDAAGRHYERSCLELHARLGLGDRFRFMGPTTDPHGVMRDADVVLLTSISEGLPMVVLEAMSQGRPVVATAVGGVPEVVRGCGAVCPPGDDHALAMAVVTLLRNPSLSRRLGVRGHRRLVRRFSESACIDRYRELLLSMAGLGEAPDLALEAAA